jgi:hypothetical protein
VTEVSKHQRKTASGKTVTVRHHTRKGGQGGGEEERHPPGTWYIQEGDDIYAVHPDGSTHLVPTARPEPSAPMVGSPELAALSQPAAQDEDWWADDEPTAGDLWADEQAARDSVTYGEPVDKSDIVAWLDCLAEADARAQAGPPTEKRGYTVDDGPPSDWAMEEARRMIEARERDEEWVPRPRPGQGGS